MPTVIVCDWIPPEFGAVGQYMHRRALGLAAAGQQVVLIGLGQVGQIEHHGLLTIVRLAASDASVPEVVVFASAVGDTGGGSRAAGGAGGAGGGAGGEGSGALLLLLPISGVRDGSVGRIGGTRAESRPPREDLSSEGTAVDDQGGFAAAAAASA